jgi:hypothetical protein
MRPTIVKIIWEVPLSLRNGFSQFLLRGLEKVRLEWKIAAIAHNPLKITTAIMRKDRILPVLG